MSLSKISIAVFLTLTISAVTIVGAAKAGNLSFLGVGPTDEGLKNPIINGTIGTVDNKTYGILIIPRNGTVTAPPVVTPPSVNNTPPTPVPVPTPVPTPQPTCEPDERIIDGKCVEIPRPTCPANTTYNRTDNTCVPNPQPVPTPTPIPPINNTADNDTVPTPTPVPQPTPVPTPQPTPQPTPVPQPTTGTIIKVAMVGDLEDSDAGTKVFYSIKIGNYSNVIALGDLGYADNLAWFKSTYGTLGNKLNCVLGNHESASEDGSTQLESEGKTFCGNSWYIKKNHVLFLGFNTNGDLTKQAADGTKLLQNTAFMDGIKSVHVISHKSCSVPPNSHHTVETKAFCDTIKSKIPSTIKQYWDSGHNHVMSESADKVYKQAGAGGRSHYTCGVSTAFPYCDNVHYGYLEYTIKPDGTTTSLFKDYTGKVLH